MEIEFRHGALRSADDVKSAAFFFRLNDGEEEARLTKLKADVRANTATVSEFNNHVTLGDQVRAHVQAILARDFAAARELTPLDEERAAHEAFAASRRRAYIPNQKYLKRITEYVEASRKSDESDLSDQSDQSDQSDKRSPLVVYAESGSGKSALLAHWAAQYRRKNPDAFIVEHYIGIGAGATDHLARSDT